MARKRSISPYEAHIWLGVLLDAAFDQTSRTLSLSSRDGQTQLLALAGDLTAYPDDYSAQRQAELLLAWAERWIQPEDWGRLAARVRKRRQRLA
jgi:hypothetical protein